MQPTPYYFIILSFLYETQCYKDTPCGKTDIFHSGVSATTEVRFPLCLVIDRVRRLPLVCNLSTCMILEKVFHFQSGAPPPFAPYE